MAVNHKMTGWGVLALCVLISIILTCNYVKMWKDDIIVPGPGVTSVKWLSDYVPILKGTQGDTRVFILDSGVPGSNILVLTGHHADEPGGWMSGMVLVEHAKVTAGKLVVIPQANNSGFTHDYPQEAHPQKITIPRPDGSARTYRLGSRTGNSADHWPDPEVFIQYPSGQKLSGDEVRNLNRAYPGRLDGTFVERTAYGIRQVVLTEKIDLQIDMHEAQPEYPFVNAVSAHPRAEELAMMAALGMQMHDLDLGVEVSPPTFRGLSNREMGDHTPVLAVTAETPNAIQGKIRGITDELLPVQGKDEFYVAADKLGNLFVRWTEKGWPLERRVGRHLTMLGEFGIALSDMSGKPFEAEGIPDYAEVTKNGVGYYLNPPPAETEVPLRAMPGFWRLFTQKN